MCLSYSFSFLSPRAPYDTASMYAIFRTISAVLLLSETLVLGSGSVFEQPNGNERLLGSSFGFPGRDETFDYVVSS